MEDALLIQAFSNKFTIDKPLSTYTHIVKHGLVVCDDVIRQAYKTDNSPPLKGMCVIRIQRPMPGLFISFGKDDLIGIEPGLWMTPINLQNSYGVSGCYSDLYTYFGGYKMDISLDPKWMLLDVKGAGCDIIRYPSDDEVSAMVAYFNGLISRKRKRRGATSSAPIIINSSADVGGEINILNQQRAMLKKTTSSSKAPPLLKAAGREYRKDIKTKMSKIAEASDIYDEAKREGTASLLRSIQATELVKRRGGNGVPVPPSLAYKSDIVQTLQSKQTPTELMLAGAVHNQPFFDDLEPSYKSRFDEDEDLFGDKTYISD